MSQCTIAICRSIARLRNIRFSDSRASLLSACIVQVADLDFHQARFCLWPRIPGLWVIQWQGQRSSCDFFQLDLIWAAPRLIQKARDARVWRVRDVELNFRGP